MKSEDTASDWEDDSTKSIYSELDEVVTSDDTTGERGDSDEDDEESELEHPPRKRWKRSQTALEWTNEGHPKQSKDQAHPSRKVQKLKAHVTDPDIDYVLPKRSNSVLEHKTVEQQARSPRKQIFSYDPQCQSVQTLWDAIQQREQEIERLGWEKRLSDEWLLREHNRASQEVAGGKPFRTIMLLLPTHHICDSRRKIY